MAGAIVRVHLPNIELSETERWRKLLKEDFDDRLNATDVSASSHRIQL